MPGTKLSSAHAAARRHQRPVSRGLKSTSVAGSRLPRQLAAECQLLQGSNSCCRPSCRPSRNLAQSGHSLVGTSFVTQPHQLHWGFGTNKSLVQNIHCHLQVEQSWHAENAGAASQSAASDLFEQLTGNAFGKARKGCATVSVRVPVARSGMFLGFATSLQISVKPNEPAEFSVRIVHSPKRTMGRKAL